MVAWMNKMEAFEEQDCNIIIVEFKSEEICVESVGIH